MTHHHVNLDIPTSIKSLFGLNKKRMVTAITVILFRIKSILFKKSPVYIFIYLSKRCDFQKRTCNMRKKKKKSCTFGMKSVKYGGFASLNFISEYIVSSSRKNVAFFS